jgi:hypothetical protein
MRQTIYIIAVGAVLIAGAPTLSVAAPALSSTAVLKNTAAPIMTDVRCELTGWDWSGAGLAGALRPGILAVGGYYNSLSYGYSGTAPYYGVNSRISRSGRRSSYTCSYYRDQPCARIRVCDDRPDTARSGLGQCPTRPRAGHAERCAPGHHITEAVRQTHSRPPMRWHRPG